MRYSTVTPPMLFILASQVGQEYEAWLKRVINMLCFSEQHEPSRDGVPD